MFIFILAFSGNIFVLQFSIVCVEFPQTHESKEDGEETKEAQSNSHGQRTKTEQEGINIRYDMSQSGKH